MSVSSLKIYEYCNIHVYLINYVYLISFVHYHVINVNNPIYICNMSVKFGVTYHKIIVIVCIRMENIESNVIRAILIVDIIY